MVNYKEKVCVLCDSKFIPSSPKQKYCLSCKEAGRRIADRNRDKKRSRAENGYIEYTRFCRVCGIRFKTFYKKKVYCGSVYCETVRGKTNGRRTDAVRKDKLKFLTKERQSINRDNKLKTSIAYIESFGYKVLDSTNYVNSHFGKFELLCPKGHIWGATYHAFKDLSARCFQCYISNNYTSKPEQKLRDYFANNYPNLNIIYNDRTQIHPKELDLYFPDHKVAVEVCGLYWHSEENGKPKDYHYNKMISCYDKGIRLITLFEDEIYYKFDVVISIILKALGLFTYKVDATDCSISVVNKKYANCFIENNCLDNDVNFSDAFGLFYNNELVGLIAVNKADKLGDIEIKYFCESKYTVIIGAIKKLFEHLKKDIKNTGYNTLSYVVDMRYNSTQFEQGFKLKGHIKTTAHYFKNGKRYKDLCMAAKAEDNGHDSSHKRIWDCGHHTYVYKLN
jgi:hypothetical protein